VTSAITDVAAAGTAWGWRTDQITPHPGGLINETFAVRDAAGAAIAALQRLHPIWRPEVNLDIEAVTAHVAARGLTTPRLVRTLDGRAWLDHAGRVWRALTWIDGETVHAVPDPAWAEAGGALVGRYHVAVADLAHDYHFTRPGVHDTAAHLGRLRERVERGGSAHAEAIEIGREVLAASDRLTPLGELPRRHVHGDLKVSNVMFRRAAAGAEAVALVDLDTLGRGTLAFELGDAMRSWCNPHGEDAGAARFELPIFAAAIRGFRAQADDVCTADERVSIVSGLETVCIELAARFAVDAFDDSYFGWDPSRFASRRAHNLVRARGQLALGLSVRAQRDEALDVVRG
jgi:Ser/Thr protein kinase RdoA (MazF antagonist)